jgi:glycosyltransferase involved in cell wall biosynthesis
MSDSTLIAERATTSDPKGKGMSEPVSIIVPAFNEVEIIRQVLGMISGCCSENSVQYELIVVDDGSADGTAEVVGAIEGVRLIRHGFNQGYGAALKTGIRQSHYPLIAIIDADGTYPSDVLPQLLACMDQCDMAVGARTGEHVKIPFLRRPAKWILKKLAEYLSGRKIPDLNSGLRVFRRELAERFFGIFPDGFSFTTTITLAALTGGYRVQFLPINYYKRVGQSTIKPIRDFTGFLLLIIRLIVYFKPLNVFLPVSGMLLVVGVTKAVIDFYGLNHFGVGAAIAILAALQIAFMGLLADLITRRPGWSAKSDVSNGHAGRGRPETLPRL